LNDSWTPTIGFKVIDPLVSLTFDDGPHPETTVDVLNVLKRFNIHATFFMIGELADTYPDIVRMVYEDGHTIANHSWDHPDFRIINLKDKYRQIIKCNRAIRRYSAKYFRPPWGRYDDALLLEAKMLGYEIILWNLEAEDWTASDDHSIAGELLHNIQPGKIILLHDNIYKSKNLTDEEKSKIIYDRSMMVRGLEKFLLKARSQYHFVPISTLFKKGTPIKKYRKCNYLPVNK
jgi:peptidoglycan/xylan/chitin deacetylase (PgdA/CDA1 family)